MSMNKRSCRRWTIALGATAAAAIRPIEAAD